jgi:hypothetical protein
MQAADLHRERRSDAGREGEGRDELHQGWGEGREGVVGEVAHREGARQGQDGAAPGQGPAPRAGHVAHGQRRSFGPGLVSFFCYLFFHEAGPIPSSFVFSLLNVTF